MTLQLATLCLCGVEPTHQQKNKVSDDLVVGLVGSNQ